MITTVKEPGVNVRPGSFIYLSFATSPRRHWRDSLMTGLHHRRYLQMVRVSSSAIQELGDTRASVVIFIECSCIESLAMTSKNTRRARFAYEPVNSTRCSQSVSKQAEGMRQASPSNCLCSQTASLTSTSLLQASSSYGASGCRDPIQSCRFCEDPAAGLAGETTDTRAIGHGL